MLETILKMTSSLSTLEVLSGLDALRQYLSSHDVSTIRELSTLRARIRRTSHVSRIKQVAVLLMRTTVSSHSDFKADGTGEHELELR